MRRMLLLATFLFVAAPAVLAQDAVKVDAKHYTVVLDNDQVRVLKVKYDPKEKSVMHEHPAGVAVFLTDANGKFTFADGKSADIVGKAGQVLFTDAGKHLPENTGDKPFEVIVVELKGDAAKGSTPLPMDALKAAPENHKLEFENDRVRVIRAWIKPQETTKEHEHPNSVAIFLTDFQSKVTPAGKATEERSAKWGEVRWLAAERHAVQNVSDKPADIIVVELKK